MIIFSINKLSIRIFLSIFFILLSSCSYFEGNDSSYHIQNNRLVVPTDFGEIIFSGLGNGAIEVHYQEIGLKQLPSFAIKEIISPVKLVVEETAKSIRLNNGILQAVFNKTDFSISFYRGSELLVTQERYFSEKKKIGFDFKVDSTEILMGGGERVLGMNRRGHRMPLYNRAHYGYTTESNQMYYSLPYVMSSKKYSVLFDNSANGFLDITKTKKNTLTFEAVGGRTAYIIFVGETFPNLINNYVDVTGKQPLPPRWAFGNYASRFGYKTQQQVLDTITQFKTDDIPVDALILDLYWFGNDIKGFMGNLDWDRQTFPTPIKMIADLKAQGIKTILVTEPFILSSSNRWQEAVDKSILVKDASSQTPNSVSSLTSDSKPTVRLIQSDRPKRFDFYFGNTGLIDVFDDKGKAWFSDIYTNLSNQGVAGVWGDLGEPEVHPDDSLHFISEIGQVVRGDEIHNVYGHQWAKLVYENQLEIQPNVRPFIMMRSGFAGSQRYGMIPWTGDVSRSWDGLKPQVELSLQMGLSGLGYTHSDLGGFAGGDVFEKELYIRWLQYGVFQPVYRPHAQDNIAPEPIFHDKQTKDIIRAFIKLRYRLLPYIYSMAYENSTTGMPLMRPLFFEDENNLRLYQNKSSYLWGDAFLVSPITKPDEKQHTIELPAGVWFDYWTDNRYSGSQSINFPVTLKTFPVLVRAGSFIPMIDSINNTSQYSSKNLTLNYYADDSVKTSHYSMYEDDGKSFNSMASKQFEQLHFSAEQNIKKLEILFRQTGKGYLEMPKNRQIDLVIHNWQKPPSFIELNQIILSDELYVFDSIKNSLSIKVNWDHKPLKITIHRTDAQQGKPVIYQVLPRIFGNKNIHNKPWGTIEENGVGKFNDFTDNALEAIKEFGISHIWYTGVLHHALIRDYTRLGISNDDPDVVKGRAGSPYAVKDYYNVNPDLAVDPSNRLEEFKALIKRTHKHGMKVIIDIVPNHVARHYQSTNNPKGVTDFGANDDTSVEYKRDNNFYYVVGKSFQVPKSNNGYKALNGEKHELSDNKFKEFPAKWTGNGSRSPQPDINDWYETVKVNYGVRPDGSYDFDRLPKDFAQKDYTEHYRFWKNKQVPDSWIKFRDIVIYWTEFGVDGFRYDMAEMVPVEFWSYLNSSIKNINPDATIIAEVYNPKMYREFISLGKMDYLYDKVDFYDTVKAIMQGTQPTSNLLPIIDKFSDIDQYLLHFLENHDEQRIASGDFAGNANLGKPGMVVSALISKAPTMLFYAQALGEPGEGDAGFGDPTRTTIFDYWGIPSLQRWMNGGKFDGGQLTKHEKSLRLFYTSLLSFSANSSALNGNYAEVHRVNLAKNENYDENLFSFVRWKKNQKLIVVANFSNKEKSDISLIIPSHIIQQWKLLDGRHEVLDVLSSLHKQLVVTNSEGKVLIKLAPFESVVLVIQ